ncbi:MAG: hypothetical protein V4580_08530 [Bacteroidota bacterium]
METLNAIEKITLLVSTGIVCLANLFVMLERAKKSEKQNNNNIQKLLPVNPRVTLTVVLLLCAFLVSAQDTIYFKNKTVVVARITEVGVSEIKYQRADNLDGPNYLSSKAEIFLIKYFNGVTDSIKVVEPVVKFVEYKENPDKIRLRGNRMKYHDRTIHDREMKSVVMSLSSPETQITLKKEFKKLNEYKLKEAVLAPALFACGARIHFAALGSAFGANGGAGSENTSNLVSAFIIGAALRISGHVVNIVYRNKKKSKREDIVNIYNSIHN